MTSFLQIDREDELLHQFMPMRDGFGKSGEWICYCVYIQDIGPGSIL